jgi:Uma2 family endonuclease
MACIYSTVNQEIVMTTATRFTYQDYLQLPEGRRYEIADGNLYMIPSSTPAHQMIASRLEFALHRHVVSADLGVVLRAPCDVLLSDADVVQPDILFISKSRQAIIKDQHVAGAPDLVIDVLSPTTTERDSGVKLKLYERAGIPEYWLISPEARMIEVLGLSTDSYTSVGLYGAHDVLSSPLLPDLRIPVRDIF